MAILETIGNFFGSFWDLATDFLTLLFVIIWAVMFFVLQFYVIKAYIWIFTSIYQVLEHYGYVGKVKSYISPEIAKEE